MSLVPGRLVVIGSLGMFLRLYLQMSPLLLLALSAVALIFSSSGATARETFAPVNRSEVSSGLRWGVAAVQGRRPYMEDMYQVRARPSRAPPPLSRRCAPTCGCRDRALLVEFAWRVAQVAHFSGDGACKGSDAAGRVGALPLSATHLRGHCA